MLSRSWGLGGQQVEGLRLGEGWCARKRRDSALPERERAGEGVRVRGRKGRREGERERKRRKK